MKGGDDFVDAKGGTNYIFGKSCHSIQFETRVESYPWIDLCCCLVLFSLSLSLSLLSKITTTLSMTISPVTGMDGSDTLHGGDDCKCGGANGLVSKPQP